MSFLRNLDDHGAELHATRTSTPNGTITIELKIRCRGDHPTGVTTAMVRSITNADLTGVTARQKDQLFDVIIPNDPPSPKWNSTRRHTPTTGELERVARLYIRALEANLPPTKTVQTWLGLSRTATDRWIRQARDRGFLGSPTKPGLPGNNPKQPKPKPQ